MKDIIVTWPKDRPLQSYLDELEKAARDNKVINYRVHKPPGGVIGENVVSVSFRYSAKPPRCYMVHDGYIRGYNDVLEVTYKGRGDVTDPITGQGMRAGWYIVRNPKWHPINLIPMSGFQGFRYFDEYRAQPK